DVELPSDLTNVHLTAAKPKCGRARRHPQSGKARERVDQFFRQPVAEILALGIGIQVRKRQDGNGLFISWLLPDSRRERDVSDQLEGEAQVTSRLEPMVRILRETPVKDPRQGR